MNLGESLVSYQAISAFAVISVGYILHSAMLQYFYYYLRGDNHLHWKIQPKKSSNVGKFYFHPCINEKPERGIYHRLLTTFNLIQASIFALVITEISVRGSNRMQFSPISSYGISNVLVDLVIAVTWENIVEYYWHRLMHLRPFYVRFHKFHHFYKSPEPWDDMYIHPLEAFGYYCILYSPPFVFKCHYVAFILYMIIMGICGVLDHGGVKFWFPGFYCTEDHDAHHELFEVNYGFPFPFMDLLHGTFEGTYLGKRISCRSKREKQ